MAPTTRSSRAKAEAPPPKRPRKMMAYVLIDKTPRNRPAPGPSAEVEKGEKEKKEKSKAKPKAAAARKVKPTAKGKGKAKVQEPVSVQEEDAYPPTDPEPIQSTAITPSLDIPAVSGPAVINTPSRLPSPPPSPPRITPRPHPFFPLSTVDVPRTPRRNTMTNLPAPGIRVRYPSSLPPSSPIRSSSSPSPVRLPRHAKPPEQGFSVYAGSNGPVDDLPEDDWDDQVDQEDKENWAVGSEEDKENMFFADEDKDNLPQPTQPAEEEEVPDDDDLFVKGLQDSRDDDRWSDAPVNHENTMISAPIDDVNPFDVSGDEALLPGGSDKENESENDFEFDLPVATTDFERGILQPRSPIPSQIEATRVAQEEDPFGFFAAEQRLKERRRLEQPLAGPSTSTGARRPFGVRKDLAATESLPIASQSHSHLPPSTAPVYSDSDIEDLYATPTSVRYLPQTPRKRTEDARDMSTVMTPRHDNGREVTMRRHRPKDTSMILGVSEDASEALDMDSPSPSKGRKRSSSGLEDAENAEPPAKRTRRGDKGKGKNKENAEDPMAEVRRLEELLPKRRVVRAAKAKGKGKAKMVEESESESQSEEEEEEEEEENARGKKSGRGRRATRGKGRGRGRGRGRGAASKSEGSRGRRKKEESTDEDIREERERARNERIEYFKKLEGYQIPKENVYVV